MVKTMTEMTRTTMITMNCDLQKYGFDIVKICIKLLELCDIKEGRDVSRRISTGCRSDLVRMQLVAGGLATIAVQLSGIATPSLTHPPTAKSSVPCSIRFYSFLRTSLLISSLFWSFYPKLS